jgi:glycerol-3-phosphate acyltransferase PlsX
MRIVLDAMGSDTHPQPEIQAAVEASKYLRDEIILVGREDEIHAQLRLLTLSYPTIRVVNATEVLEMTDKPAENARRKSRNSMAVGMNLLKSG